MPFLKITKFLSLICLKCKILKIQTSEKYKGEKK